MQIKYIGVITVVLIVVFIAWVAYVAIAPGNYDEFAQCLTDKGVIMAGTDWCHFCKQQKGMFGNSFSNINYKNCDKETQWCTENGVEGFPTWFFADGSSRPGVQSFQTLSELSGCPLQ